MKNSKLRLRKLVMLFYASPTPSYVAPYTHFVNHVTLRKRHRLIAKEDHPFENGYDKSTLSYEKELPNKRVVAKVR